MSDLPAVTAPEERPPPFAAAPLVGTGPVSPALIAAAETARARIESAYVIAMRRPRNPDQARQRILHDCRRPAFADRVEYRKKIGSGFVTGPSIRFAETALRNWGNVLSDIRVTYEDETTRRIAVTITDLETNATFGKELSLAKTVERRNPTGREVLGERTNTRGDKVFVVRATEEEMYTKEAAMISRVVRNEGLRLIPSDVVDEAITTAREVLRDRDAKDPDAAKKALLDAFAGIGVAPVDLEAYLGHPTNRLAPKELEDLRGAYRAIRDGESTWQDYVGRPPVSANGERPDFRGTAPPSAAQANVDSAMAEARERHAAASAPPQPPAGPPVPAPTAPTVPQPPASPPTAPPPMLDGVTADVACRSCMGTGLSRTGRRCRRCHGVGIDPDHSAPPAEAPAAAPTAPPEPPPAPAPPPPPSAPAAATDTAATLTQAARTVPDDQRCAACFGSGQTMAGLQCPACRGIGIRFSTTPVTAEAAPAPSAEPAPPADELAAALGNSRDVLLGQLRTVIREAKMTELDVVERLRAMKWLRPGGVLSGLNDDDLRDLAENFDRFLQETGTPPAEPADTE